ncbi:MAG: winged helix-turn-helix domain-containing protein, partial [Betaproteobacteria bacterium]
MLADRVQIGRWRFDRSLNTLTSDIDAVRIEPKVADLLHRLASRAGDVVSRQALLDAVWPGVVVGDEALSQSIQKLRRALGDTSREATYIQTVPKRGYRLIAPVTSITPVNAGPDIDASADVVVGSGSQPPRIDRSSDVVIDSGPQPPRAMVGPLSTSRGRRTATMAAAAIALALAVVLLWQHSDRNADLDAIVALQSTTGSSAPTLPEVQIRRFDALGDDAATQAAARAIWKQVVAGVSQSSRLRVIADTRDGPRPEGPSPLYQVDGTVQRLDDRLVLQLVLSKPASGVVQWSQTFALPLRELSGGHDIATAGLLDALTVTLSKSERERLARPYTPSVVAFDHFLDGQAAFGARDRQGNIDARNYFSRAVAEDPSFARAYAGLALTHAADATFGWSHDRNAAIELAIADAQRAQALDPSLPEVHWALGWVELQRHQQHAALKHARRAIELNPSYADAYALAASTATYIGHPKATLSLMRTAMRLQPVHGFLYRLVLGRAYFLSGDDVQAVANLRVAESMNPGHLETHVYLAAALQRQGDVAGATWQAEEIRSLAPTFALGPWLDLSLLDN